MYAQFSQAALGESLEIGRLQTYWGTHIVFGTVWETPLFCEAVLKAYLMY